MGTLELCVNQLGNTRRLQNISRNQLAIEKETGNRNEEASSYANLGIVYHSVGEYDKAKVHLEKSLAIQKETEEGNGKASCILTLGTVYPSIGEHEKARENLEESLVVQ